MIPQDEPVVTLERVLRQCQIIIACLIAGVTTFAALVLLVLPGTGRPATGPLLSFFAIGVTATCLGLSWLVPRLISDRAVRELAGAPRSPEDMGRLLAGFQTKTVVAGALCEGPVFLALVSYMVERSPIALAAAAPALLLLMLQFPTRPALEAWLDDRLRQLDDLRR